MADIRLKNSPKPVVRFVLAHPLAFADWKNPTSAELNANLTNDPAGLVWNITCAVSQDDTTHDLGDSDTDDSLSFCQVAGDFNPVTYNPDILWSIFRDAKQWKVSDSTTESVANLAFSLLSHRGVEYFAIASVGEAYDEPFAPGQRVKMARVETDFIADVLGSGATVRGNQDFAARGDLNWNYELVA